MKYKLIPTCFFLLIPVAFGQHLLSPGFIGGVGLTDAFSNTTTMGVDTTLRTYSDAKDYIVGPSLQVNLPFGLAVEGDALFRPLSLATQNTVLSTVFSTSTRVTSWEFPILAKYRLPIPLAKPFIEAGPSFRTTGNYNLSNAGFTIGGGVEIHAILMRISPQIRYTHWAADGKMTSGTTARSSSRLLVLTSKMTAGRRAD